MIKCSSKIEEEPMPLHKAKLENKDRGPPPPLCYLTLEEVKAAIDDMASTGTTTAQLIPAPKKKELRDIAMTDGVKGKHFFLERLKRVQTSDHLRCKKELRDIAMTDGVKAKHIFFFLESDIKGSSLNLDNTRKTTLTVETLCEKRRRVVHYHKDGLDVPSRGSRRWRLQAGSYKAEADGLQNNLGDARGVEPDAFVKDVAGENDCDAVTEEAGTLSLLQYPDNISMTGTSAFSN